MAGLSVAPARDDRPGTYTSGSPHRRASTLTMARPGLREKYRSGYYGAFALDPDGNSIEAVHKENIRTDGRCIDHAWLRVRDVAASRQFYETIATVLGFRLRSESATHAHFRANSGGLVVTSPNESWSDARPLTENVHLAFPAPDRATVDEFHQVALAAGYRDNGPQEERRYRAGYYGAFVLDPDGNNVEAVVHDPRIASSRSAGTAT
jgi:catechol 2,3-dioxygenase-like lactoylglutathione lyase family enzyme